MDHFPAALDLIDRHSGPAGIHEMTITVGGQAIWAGDDIDNLHRVYSCSKLFVSMSLALLVDDGLCDLDSPVCRWVPEICGSWPEYERISFRHLVTHTSGYDAVGGFYHAGNLDGSSTPWIPAAPFFAPGERFCYWDDAVNLTCVALTRMAGESLESLIRRRVVRPLGIPDDAFGWELVGTLDGLPICNGAAGVSITSRHLPKVGELYMAKGRCGGRQILPSWWAEQAIVDQTPAGIPLDPYGLRFDSRGMYGYHWWLNIPRPDGSRMFPSAPPDMYFCYGYPHNRIFVLPSLDLVIVRLCDGEDGPPSKESALLWNEFFDLILQEGART